jgi:hypothetical protein
MFKSRCNIFSGFGIIKELPGLVGSGTLCITNFTDPTFYVLSLAGIAGSNPVRNMDVCLLCFVLSVRGLCVGLITHPEEFYRVWRV